jgi:serine O-acetyltransferase
MGTEWWRAAYLEFKADRALYARNAWITDPALWAIAVYRLGRASLQAPHRWQWFVGPGYTALATLVGWITHIELPRTAVIGAGLRIHHSGPVIVHGRATLGARVTLRTGVVVGHGSEEDAVPVIGDDVEFGAHSMVIGRVHVGNGAKIGAMALVNCDLPPGARAVGPSARILP